MFGPSCEAGSGVVRVENLGRSAVGQRLDAAEDRTRPSGSSTELSFRAARSVGSASHAGVAADRSIHSAVCIARLGGVPVQRVCRCRQQIITLGT